ncbi:MAG: hypothetical protein PHP42_09340 [Bacteroidota bacterium]|nr:hypothetical protein [Bacteroidota bacterium]
MLILILVCTTQIFGQIVIKDSIAISPKAKKQFNPQSGQTSQGIIVPPCTDVQVELVSESGVYLRDAATGEIFIDIGAPDGYNNRFYGPIGIYYSDSHIPELKFYLAVGYWTRQLGLLGYVLGPPTAISAYVLANFGGAEVRLDSNSISTSISQLSDYVYGVHLDYADSGWTYNDPPGFWNGTWFMARREYHAVLKVTLTNVSAADHFDVTFGRNSIAHNDSTQIFVQAKDKYGNSTCYSGDIQITAPPFDYGNFKTETIKPFDPITVSYDTARSGYVYYIANGVKPDTLVTDSVSVVSIDNPLISGYGKIGIKPQSVFHHFAVNVVPDTVEHLQSATIYVQAKDEYNDDIFIDPETPMTMKLNDITFGHLEANTSSGYQSGQEITGTFNEMNSVNFIADGADPDSMVQTSIQAYETSDRTKHGEASVTITSAVNYFEITAIPSTIPYGDTSTVIVKAKRANGQDAYLSDATLLGILRIPQNYGWLEVAQNTTVASLTKVLIPAKAIQRADDRKQIARAAKSKTLLRKESKPNTTMTIFPLDFTYGDGRLGRLKFIAQGDVPDSVQVVDLFVSQNDMPNRQGEGSVTITKELPWCPHVSLSSEKISSGDTIIVKVVKKYTNDTYKQFPAGTQFRFTLQEGSQYGALVGPGGTGPDITSANPVQFIANASIDVDSIVVKIFCQMVAIIPAGAQKKNIAQVSTPSTCAELAAYVTVKDCEIGTYSCSNDPFKLDVTHFSSFEWNLPECSMKGNEGLGVTFYDSSDVQNNKYILRQSFNPCTCYDPIKKKWFLQGGTLMVKIRASICSGVAAKYHSLDIKTIDDITSENYDCAYNNFKDAISQDNIDSGVYPLSFFIWSSEGTKIHKSFHINNYETAIMACYYGWYDAEVGKLPSIEKMLREVIISKCDAKTNSEAKQKMKGQIDKVYDSYEQNIEQYFKIKDRESIACETVKEFYKDFAEQIVKKAKKNNWTKPNPCLGF